ncbi:hypothetical protein Pelo_5272 [Pelomyxa schiedti]|nr:hypothetical protein Pelo_5272 [Pelomyxa schiedti]
MGRKTKYTDEQVRALVVPPQFHIDDTPAGLALALHLFDNGISFAQASRIHGVDKAVVHRAFFAHRDGRPLRQKGRPPLLTPPQKDKLLTWMHEKVTANEHPTQVEIRAQAKHIILTHNPETVPTSVPECSETWWRLFSKKHALPYHATTTVPLESDIITQLRAQQKAQPQKKKAKNNTNPAIEPHPVVLTPVSLPSTLPQPVLSHDLLHPALSTIALTQSVLANPVLPNPVLPHPVSSNFAPQSASSNLVVPPSSSFPGLISPTVSPQSVHSTLIQPNNNLNTHSPAFLMQFRTPQTIANSQHT